LFTLSKYDIFIQIYKIANPKLGDCRLQFGGKDMGNNEARSALVANIEEAPGWIDSLISSAWEVVITDTDAAKKIIDRVKRISESSGNDKGNIECLLLEARYDGEMDRYADALQKTNEAYQKYIQSDDTIGQIKACRVFGYLFSRHGKYDSALEHLFIALKLIKESSSHVNEGIYPIEVFLLNNIGFIYAETNKYNEALKYFYQAFELAKNGGGSMISTILTNIAEMHLNLGDSHMALRYNKMALTEIKQQKLGFQDMHNCYNSFGLIYNKMGQHDKAMESLRQSLDAAIKGESKYNQIIAYFAIAKLQLQAQENDEAVLSISIAYRLADEIKANMLLRDICLVMAQLYEKTGEMTSALEYFKKHMDLNYAISTQEVERRLSDFSSEFKAEQAMKDAEIYRLKNIELKQKSMELEESNRNITFISEIGQKITASLDIEKVLNIFYESISKLMDVSVFGVGLYNEAKGTLTFRMVIENSVRLPLFELSIKEDKGYAHECIAGNREIVVNDVIKEDASKAKENYIITNGIAPRSLIFYPLLLAGNIIGMLTVQSYTPNAYTRNNVETIKALRSYIAIALNNSQKSEELRQKARELELLSKTDPLTGIYNRRYIIEKMEEERIRFRRYGNKFTLIILDIDLFKKVNDAYGHDCGDYVLIETAKLIKQLLREQDCLARWGGEEFLVMLPETDAAGAKALADRIRISVQDRVFEYRKKKISVTLTMGISVYCSGLSVDDTIRKADNALYEGKNRGRNCVVINS
jgi:diguanylate cyclase (GGDEF)-like protein